MTAMTAPRETKNLDIYGNPPLEWKRVTDALNGTGDLEVADSASRFWIGTTRPDGRPHMAAVGIVWDDGRFYLSTGAGTQKGRNLVRDPRCTISIAAPGVDIVAEGEAKIIRDDADAAAHRQALRRLGSGGPGWRLLARVQRAERGSSAVGRLRDHTDNHLRGGNGGAAWSHSLAPAALGCAMKRRGVTG